jgi:hypothetical protein
MMKTEGDRSFPGEISDWKSATPRLTGAAKTRANVVVTIDPYIEGNAPNEGGPSGGLGFQSVPTKNLNPKNLIDSALPFPISKIMSTAMTGIIMAATFRKV